MIDTALETLSLYCWFHFRREVRVLEDCNYPEVGFHRREHQEFGRYLSSLRDSFTGRAEPELAADLFYELAAWIRHHILIEDLTFKPYIHDAERAERVARAGTAACVIELGGERRRRAVPVRRMQVAADAAVSISLGR